MSEAAPISTTKPPCLRADALAVLRRLRQAGHVAYFAGGCVRDLLLGREPKDFDVATDAPPKRVRELFSHTQAVGQAFGVILVRQGKSTVEVATFRAEGTYSDGRHPDSVVFTTADQDAKRRDFTINGLYLDPEKAGERSQKPEASSQKGEGARCVEVECGVVIDFVGGVEDLERGVLRAIGDPHRRFAEDHLRLLRAVRFAARFGLAVERETAEAIRMNAPKLRGISPERIADELRLMLTPPTRAAAWPMLWEFALIDVIFRMLPSGEGAEFVAERSLFLKLAPGEAVSFGLALAAAAVDYRLLSGKGLHDVVTRAEIQRIGRAVREALKVSNEELDEVVGVLEPVGGLLAEEPPTLAFKKRFLARATASQTRALLRGVSGLGMEVERIEALEREFAELEKTAVAPEPLITGDDLVAAGFRPGPVFRRILDGVYDAQLEGRVGTREAAMEMARGMKG